MLRLRIADLGLRIVVENIKVTMGVQSEINNPQSAILYIRNRQSEMRNSSNRQLVKAMPNPKCLIFILLVFALSNQIACAQPATTDSVNNSRTEEIRYLFYSNRKQAQNWWVGWLAGYTAATAAQGAVYILAESTSTKQDMALGAATTILGALGQVVSPMVPGNSSYKEIQKLNESSPSKYNDPQYYEELLKEISKREKAGRSWKMHAVSGAVNLGSGIITWRGFHRSFSEGAINFAMNTVITEAQILTIPRRAERDYEKYTQKYFPQLSTTTYKMRPEFIVGAWQGGICMRIIF